jgi:hypothetical protein
VNYALHRLYLRALAIGIASLIVLQTAIAGQSSAGVVIQVLEANAGQNLISQELPPIKVRVMDRTGLGIPGANVTFAAPEGDSFGHFLPNATQVRVTTDTQGIATAPRFRTNSTVGDYGIQVVASYGDSISRVEIPQSNVVKRKSSNKKLFIISAVIGGAAAAALAGKGGDSGPASTALGALATPTVTVGGSSVAVTPSVAAPAAATSSSSTSATTAAAPTAAAAASTVVQPVAPTQTQPSASSNCKGLKKKGDCR